MAHVLQGILILWCSVGALVFYDRIDDNLTPVKRAIWFSVACGPLVWLVVVAVVAVVAATRLFTKLFS